MERSGDRPQLRLRARGGRTRREPRVHGRHPMRPFVLHRRAHVVIVRGVVDVEVLFTLRRVVRARLQHADDLRLLGREIERLADDGRVRPEHALPVPIGEHHDRRGRLDFVGGHEHPSEQRLRAEHREEVRGHQSAHGAVRLVAPEHAERKVAEFDELVDRLRPSAVVGHLGKRERRILYAGGDLRLPQVHDAVGFRIRKRPQEHTVDDAENRRVRADAESEREHERDGKSRHAGQIPECDADVVDHRVPRRWMTSHSRKAAIVPIPNRRNPLTRNAVNRWGGPGTPGIGTPPSRSRTGCRSTAVAGYGFSGCSGFLGGAAGFS